VDVVVAQHQQGLGFGEIARAYFLARELAADDDPNNDMTVDQILALHQAGQGWGQIVRSLGLPQSNRNRNLGLIRGNGHHKGSDISGTPTAPQSQDAHDDTNNGQDKHGNKGGAANGPPAGTERHGSSNNGQDKHNGGNGGGKSNKGKKSK